MLHNQAALDSDFPAVELALLEILGQAFDFKASLGQYFDVYRQRITGAQAAVKELDILIQRVLNANMSDPAFQYNYNKAVNTVKKQIRIQRMIAEKGVTGEDFWKEFNRITTLGIDPSVEPENRDVYGDKIAQDYMAAYPGANEEEIERYVVERLKAEGYLK